MNVEDWFFNSFLYPAYHRFKRDDVLSSIREYSDNQWRSADAIRALQYRKLEALLVHARNEVPYYRKLLPAEGSVAKLTDFPVLTKSIIREHKDLLVAGNADRSSLEPNRTSGSTGEALYFYTDRRSSDSRKAAVVRNRSWAGIGPSDREVRLWGSPIDTEKSQRWRGRLHGKFTRSRMINAFDLSRSSLQRYLEMMADFRPRLLIAYPSVLEELAHEMKESGVRIPGLHAIIVSAETLFPYQRALFASVFHADIFNRYGSREVGDIAQECALHDGLHINSERVVVEIVREDMTACAPGEVGEVLVTDLDNYGMPLIRYAIGDRASFSEKTSCSCGRGLPLLKEVEGRSFDVVRFPNGVAVGGTYWTFLLKSRPGLEQIQIVQETLQSVVVRYVGKQPIDDAFMDFIRDDVGRRAGAGFEVLFERVDSIPRHAGKRRLVSSSVARLPAASP